MTAKELLFYKPQKGSLLLRFSRHFRDKSRRRRPGFYTCLQELADLSSSHGYSGNLWHSYLTHYLVTHENTYSLGCEIAGDAGGSVSSLVKQDFSCFQKLFAADLGGLLEKYGIAEEDFLDFSDENTSGRVFGVQISARINELTRELEQADTVEAFRSAVSAFYRQYGVGMFGLHKAFRLDDDGKIVPIAKISPVEFSDLIGYERQKSRLMENTEVFLRGKTANNCMLYGDAGTGKSSSMKALVNQYYGEGLRMIEVYKHQLSHLNEVISAVKNRRYKFILYMDDLSFEEFETDYKYLKAIIEGGLEKKPENLLIYATSNRRHLIREFTTDRADMDDMNKSDTKQEKLSLSARFGIKIYYGAPDKKEYEQICLGLAKKQGITLPEKELLLAANEWEIRNGGRSGRCARQLVDHLSGTCQERGV